MIHAHGTATIIATDDSRSIPLDTRSVEQYGGELVNTSPSSANDEGLEMETNQPSQGIEPSETQTQQFAYATFRNNPRSFSKEAPVDGSLTSAAAPLQKNFFTSRKQKVLHAGCLNRVIFGLLLFFLICINFDLSRHFLHVYDEGQDAGTGTGITRNAQSTVSKSRNGIAYDRVHAFNSTTSSGNNDLMLFDVGRVNVINDIGVGEWIMDTWIPPQPWRLFSPSEIQAIFSNYSMLWIGDSTARRAATTLYGILNSTMDIDQDGRIINIEDNTLKSSSSLAFIDEAGKGIGRYTPQYTIDGANIVDVNKGVVTEPCDKYQNFSEPLRLCRPMPISPKKFLFQHPYSFPLSERNVLRRRRRIALMMNNTNTTETGSKIALMMNNTNTTEIGNKTVAAPTSKHEDYVARHIDKNMTKADDDVLVHIEKNITSMAQTATNTMVAEKEFGIYASACTRNIELFAQNELNNITNYTDIFDLFVIAIGAWEGVRPNDCKERNRTTLERYNASFNALEQLASTKRHVTFVVRSSGFHKQGSGSNKIHLFNQFVEARIFNYTKMWYYNYSSHDPSYNGEERRSQPEGRALSFSSFFGVGTKKTKKDQSPQATNINSKSPSCNILFVDWAKVIAIRSFGNLRIDGDILPHYGVGARLSLIQMIANTLAFR